MMLRFLGAAAGASRPWARRPRGPAALARFGSSNSASSSSPNDDQVVTPCDAGLHNPPVKLHVVGSSAMGPSLRRSSNSQALRIWNDVWLFDCGEGTQRQLMSSNEVTISHVRKIFITHMHGDHVMGLPGLLTSLFGHWSSAEEYVEVFGPPGLRRFLHDCFASTYAFTTVNFVVHELWGWDPHDLPTGLTRFGGVDRPPVGTEVGLSPSWWPPPLSDEQRARVLERERHEQQRARDLGQLPSTEGLNIFPTRVASPLAPSERQHHHLRGRGRRGAGCGGGGGGGGGRRSRAQDYYWELPFSDDSPAAQKFRVVAAPLVHTVPCVGYVVTEADTPGKVRMTPELRARLEDPRNVEFCRARGMDTPFMALRLVRQGETLELADGMLRPEDVLYPPTQGRRIAILGDTSNASAGADLLVHEATKSPDHFAPSPDQRLSEKARRRFRRNEAQTRKRNFQSGHSSPDVAGRFATDVGAEALLLNHFSQSQGHNQGVLDVVRSYAKRAFAGRLRLAADFMTIDVPVRTTTADRSEAAAEAAQAQAEASFSTDRYQPWFPHSFHDRVEGKQVVPIPQGSAAAAAAAVEGSRGPNGDGPARRVRRPLQRFLKQDRKGTKQPAQGRAQVLLNRQQQRERQQAKRQAEAAAAATGSER